MFVMGINAFCRKVMNKSDHLTLLNHLIDFILGGGAATSLEQNLSAYRYYSDLYLFLYFKLYSLIKAREQTCKNPSNHKNIAIFKSTIN